MLKNIHNIPQLYDWDCGVSVVQTSIYHLSGKKLSHRRVTKALGSKTDYGTNFWSMEQGIKKLDKSLRVDTFTLADTWLLMQWDNPDTLLIVDWWDMTDGHFSIIADITKEYIVLVDPQYSRYRTVDFTTFMTNWFDWGGTSDNKSWIDRGLIRIIKT